MNKKLFIASLSLLVLLLVSTFIRALPSTPTITFISNSTVASQSANRTSDQKGHIITLTLDANQQSYKWKAYVGNVSGKLALDDANAKSIYDWDLATVTGEVYVTRSSGTIVWANISCANQTTITSEHSALSMSISAVDGINRTFNASSHQSFLVGTVNITTSSCRSIDTYVNDTRQTFNETARFQEVLLQDNPNSQLVYATVIEQDQLGYNGVSTYDFQLLVAENESNLNPTTYFFYAELG